MNKKEFNVLVEKFGSKVVWEDVSNGEFCFFMNDELLNVIGSEGEEDYYKLVDGCENVDGVKCWLGYGDDVINCVSVRELKDFDKVEGLEEFVLKYVGKNCYSEE